jgi:hypothetical protein
MTGDEHTPLSAVSHDLGNGWVRGPPQRIADRLPVDSREYVGDLMNTSADMLTGIVQDESASQPR